MQEQTKNGCVVRFESVSRKDEAESLKQNRPIFKDVDYIEKRTPGDRMNIIFRPLTKADKAEYAQQYEHWQKTKEDPKTGTPLKEWPAVSRSQVEQLAYSGVKTVEDLAGLSDGTCQLVGAGTIAMRQSAQDWLAKAKGAGQEAHLRNELEKRDAMISALSRQVQELAAKQAGTELAPGVPVVAIPPSPQAPAAPPPAKRGRPRKQPQEVAP